MKGAHTALASAVLFCLWLMRGHTEGEVFRVATYNLESYLDQPTQTRTAKTAAAKAKVRESILALNPDVLALQELGSTSALLELQDSLKLQGLDLPFWQLISGSDTNIHSGLLSRFPLSANRSHTNESYLLSGRRFHVSRGFLEVEIQVNPHYHFTLIAAHLKSKRAAAEAEEAEMRLEEAKLLREEIDSRLQAEPNANLVVLGDFNDTKDSPAIKTVVGRGKSKLVDTRPSERNGDENQTGIPEFKHRMITWTHYYANEDSYRRIDYLFLSHGMAREWIANQSYVLATPAWGLASDHRPVVAGFEATDL